MTVTLLDIAQSTGNDGIAGLIEEVVKAVPEVMGGAARTIVGTQFKSTVRVGLPGTSFRQANLGAAIQKSRYEQRTYDCYITDTPWLCDKAVADVHQDGSAAFIASEAKAIMLAQMIMLGKQFYYGQPMVPGDTSIAFSDPLGFPGLLQMYDVANMTVDAEGSGNNCSSVWAISWGDEGVQWLFGNGENPLQLTDVKEIVLNDANGNPLTQYHQQLLAYVGLKLGSLKRVACIKNLDMSSNSTHGLTDSLLSDLYAKFPVGYTPDAFYVTRKAAGQLQKSRTPVTPTTSGITATPLPTDWNGIPIIRTDSIQDTEAAR